jgi:hypothetical protein
MVTEEKGGEQSGRKQRSTKQTVDICNSNSPYVRVRIHPPISLWRLHQYVAALDRGLGKKTVEATKHKGERRGKTHKPKPEEQGGIRHAKASALPSKRREDRKPKYHEELQKGVA